jgi:hypothetical protein
VLMSGNNKLTPFAIAFSGNAPAQISGI